MTTDVGLRTANKIQEHITTTMMITLMGKDPKNDTTEVNIESVI